MDPKKLKKLSELFGRDLSGWQIAECHILELDHGLMGTFPAIDADEKIIATLDKKALRNIWKKLPRWSAKVTSFMVVAHSAAGVAFALGTHHKGETEPLRILSAEAIVVLSRKKNSVRWASGLLHLTKEPVRDPVFD